MPVTIKVNGTNLSLVHKMSNGISTATIPDVCKTPTPGGPVPIPYPNIAQSITLSDGTTTVKGDKVMAANKGSKFSLSNGDNAGTIGGVKSNVFMKEATWILYSFDVKMDSKNACRFTDPMYHNSENTVNLGGVCQNPVIIKALGKELADDLCDAACKAKKDKKAKDKANQKKDGTFKKGKKPASYQKAMRERIDPKKRRGKNPPVLTEVSHQIKRDGGDFVGKMGKGVTGRTGRVRWDIIVTRGKDAVARGKLTWSKVRYIVEVKFPKDTPTYNQNRAARVLGKNKRKLLKLNVAKDCKC